MPKERRDMEITGKGQTFEDKVAKWAKSQFGAVAVKRNQLFKTKRLAQPLQIDIVLRTRGSFIAGDVTWIKCENRGTSINKSVISELLDNAQQVKGKADWVYPDMPVPVRKSDKEWDYFLLVSTADLDTGAIDFAKQQNVDCYSYDGSTFREIVRIMHSWP